jgi:hypothetical protein
MTDNVVSWLRKNTAIIGIAGALLLQGGATIWWTAILSQRVNAIESKVSQSEPIINQIPVMQNQEAQIMAMLEKISCDLNKLNDRLWTQFTQPKNGKN